MAALTCLLLSTACLEPPSNPEAFPSQALPPQPEPIAQQRQQPRPQPRGWFFLTGDIEIKVESAEIQAEIRPGAGGDPPELEVELMLRYGAGMAPVASIVLMGLRPDLSAGDHVVRGPEAAPGLRAFVTVQSDRVGTMRDLNREVQGVLQVDAGYSEAIAARFRISALEPPAQSFAPWPADGLLAPRAGTAPEPPPARVQAQGGFYLPLAAARSRERELLELPIHAIEQPPS